VIISSRRNSNGAAVNLPGTPDPNAGFDHGFSALGAHLHLREAATGGVAQIFNLL